MSARTGASWADRQAGRQGAGLVLARRSEERDNPAFGSAFRAWLEREQSTYSIWPAQKLLWAETIKYFPKLEAGLTKAQAAKPPMPDFDFGMPSTSTAPEPDFSTSGAFFTKIAEEVKRCMDGDRTFSKEDMVHFVQNKLFGGIPQYAVERYFS